MANESVDSTNLISPCNGVEVGKYLFYVSTYFTIVNKSDDTHGLGFVSLFVALQRVRCGSSKVCPVNVQKCVHHGEKRGSL